ncbi:MAG TPA: hypothetical protein VES67_24255 [Vicinamibacterales bacterium]|nr:hypothetical protein [Vicinamibacterales bacterium]
MRLLVRQPDACTECRPPRTFATVPAARAQVLALLKKLQGVG